MGPNNHFAPLNTVQCSMLIIYCLIVLVRIAVIWSLSCLFAPRTVICVLPLIRPQNVATHCSLSLAPSVAHTTVDSRFHNDASSLSVYAHVLIDSCIDDMLHQGRCFTKLRIGDQKKWHRNFTFGYLAIIGASPRAWF
jgi:hypothetical protein